MSLAGNLNGISICNPIFENDLKMAGGLMTDKLYSFIIKYLNHNFLTKPNAFGDRQRLRWGLDKCDCCVDCCYCKCLLNTVTEPEV